MKAMDYFTDDYEGYEEMLARAYAAGARAVRSKVVGRALEVPPLEPGVQALGTVITAEGEVIEAEAEARLGDARVPDPPLGEEDTEVADRAQRRAVRRAIRLAYPTGTRTTAEKRPSHVLMAQAATSQSARALGLSREELAEELHEVFGVASLNDVTAPQSQAIVAWLELRVRAANSR